MGAGEVISPGRDVTMARRRGGIVSFRSDREVRESARCGRAVAYRLQERTYIAAAVDVIFRHHLWR